MHFIRGSGLNLHRYIVLIPERPPGILRAAFLLRVFPLSAADELREASRVEASACMRPLVIHLAQARWLSKAYRARTGWCSGSMCNTIRATSRQSAPSSSASSRRRFSGFVIVVDPHRPDCWLRQPYIECNSKVSRRHQSDVALACLSCAALRRSSTDCRKRKITEK